MLRNRSDPPPIHPPATGGQEPFLASQGRDAFAAILDDGSVVTWGHALRGGDSSAVQDQLKNVHNIQASAFAFAAVLGDGSVVTWGEGSPRRRRATGRWQQRPVTLCLSSQD